MPDEAIQKLLSESSFSFIGTVEHIGAATMANLPVDNRTAVVHVDHVLDAPPAFVDLEGQRVTVQLFATAEPPAVGQALAFFTQGLAFGESVAVSEVGRLPVEEVEPHATAAMNAGVRAGAFQSIRATMHQAKLREHADSSDVVLVGRVVKQEKAVEASPSEHDAHWWRATVEVHHVERGKVQGNTVEVLYPNSRDVRWYDVPKPAAGADALWSLHATEGALRDLAPFQLLHAEDYQPVHTLDAIRETRG